MLFRSGPRGILSGGTLRFKINADTGYYVEKVEVNGEVVTYNSEGYYIITGVSGDAVITVELKEGFNAHDINNDSVVTVEDARAILRHITGKEKVPSEYLALLGLTEEDLTLEYAREILELVGEK